MNEQRVVAIIGMTRSGTSFVGDWLFQSGLHLGDNLLKKDNIINPKGFFEDMEFIYHLNKIYSNSSKSFKEKLFFQSNSYNVSKTDIEQGKDLIKKKMQERAQWGWKLPASALVWYNLWDPVFDELDLKNKVIVICIFRHFKQSVVSSVKMAQISKKRKTVLDSWHFSLFRNKLFNAKLKEWIVCNRNIIRIVKEGNYNLSILFDTDTLLQKSKCIYEKITDEFGLQIDYTNPSEIYEEKLMNRVINLNYHFDEELITEATEVFNELIKLRDKQSFINIV